MSGLRGGLDGFWNSGSRVRSARAGITGQFMGIVIANGIVLMMLSLLQSVSASSGLGAMSIMVSLAISLAELLVSAYFAAALWAGASRGSLSAFDPWILLRKLPALIVSSVAIYVVQAFLSAVCSMVSMLSIQVGVVLSLAVSLCVTMANAGVAYGIASGTSGVLRLMSDMWAALKAAIGASARPAVLFLVWSLIINVVYALLVTQNIVPVNGITNVLHVLIVTQDWHLLAMALALNLVNFAVSGYFELDMLIEEALRFPDRNA